MMKKFVSCWKMKMNNGKILYFTDSDENLIYENDTYLSGGYFTPGKIFSSSELGEDNFTIQGIIDEKIITTQAILAGYFTECYLEVFLVNIYDNSKIILKTGWIGEITIYENNSFVAEVCSISHKLKKVITQRYSRSCRACFADSFCKLKEEEFSVYGEVSDLLDINNAFIDKFRKEPINYYTKGYLIFISGSNKGIKYLVTEFKDSKIFIDYILPLEIKIGDQYRIIAGCDKDISTCINKFNNVINFRGEPFIPSKHSLIIGH